MEREGVMIKSVLYFNVFSPKFSKRRVEWTYEEIFSCIHFACSRILPLDNREGDTFPEDWIMSVGLIDPLQPVRPWELKSKDVRTSLRLWSLFASAICSNHVTGEHTMRFIAEVRTDWRNGILSVVCMIFPEDQSCCLATFGIAEDRKKVVNRKQTRKE